jgi:gliding motility-associated-like protein
MKRSVFVVFFLSFLSLNSIAQQEATWWYFGTNAGISFTGTGGAPVVQTNGKMNNMEGVASISNSKGGLLFYTDGEVVYNKSHNVMTNGNSPNLKGHNSSTQSAIIVQQPVRNNRYYIFTVDQEWGSNGFQYSIVDTSLNSGQGQVVTKNVPILSNVAEKVSAVKHANKVDTWVVTHTGNNNNFYVYKLNSQGLSAPVVSSVGPNWVSTGAGSKGYSKGYLKFSPDGTKLIAAVAGYQGTISYSNNLGRIEVYDFDNLTGKISNPQVIDKNNIPSGVGTTSSVYGVEFSPNGRFAYFSFYISSGAFGGDGNEGIWQMDMSSGVASTMASSILKVSTTNMGSVTGGGMQLGPDGVIYIARYNVSYLSAITKPNCKGTACTYVNSAISLSSKRSQWGIPTFIATFFNKSEFDWGSNAANLCEGSLTKLYVTDSTGMDSAKWKFNDPSTGKLDSAKGFTVYHKFSQPKTYNVFVQFYRKVPSAACYADTSRKKLTIFPNPKVTLGRDTIICDGQEVVLQDTTKNTVGRTYVWSDNTTVPTYIANTKGWHWLDVKVGGCTGHDSVYVDVIKYPKFSIGNDTLICQMDSINLKASGGTRYLWSTGDTVSTTYAKDTGMVWARAANGKCATYDTMYIKHSFLPKLNLGRDSILCLGDSLTLNAKTQDSKKYFWNDLSIDSFLTVKSSGIYWSRIKDTLCYSLRDSVKVTFQTKFKLDLGKDTSICKGGGYLINAAVAGGKNWLWQNSSTGTTHLATTAGKKYVRVTNGTCTVSDTIVISEISPPSISLGRDTTLCIGSVYDIITAPNSNFEYVWMGTVKNFSYPIKTSGKYYIDLYDLPKKVCKVSDTVVVTFKAGTKINLGNDTVLCMGQSIDLNVAKYGFKSFTWWDNATTPGIRKNDISVIKHFVTGFDGVCVTSDTINVNYRPNLSISLGADIDLCDNATKDFDITTGFATQYEWISATGSTLANTATYTVTNPGGIFVGKVSDGFCPKFDTIKVNYKSTPIVNIGADIKVCDGIPDPAILDASAAAAQSYQWNTGASLDKITVTTQGQYWVTASNGACTASDTAWVYFADSPSNSFGFADSVFCDVPNLSFDFTQPNTTYKWQDGFSSPIRKLKTPGVYWMVAENMCGKDSISVTISIDENGCRLNFPTAFSPNGDGINDVWLPTGQVVEWVELVIYDRWGEVIYKGNPFNGWDGIVGGKYVQDGIYPMTIAYRQSSGGFPRLFVKNMTLTIVK